MIARVKRCEMKRSFREVESAEEWDAKRFCVESAMHPDHMNVEVGVKRKWSDEEEIDRNCRPIEFDFSGNVNGDGNKRVRLHSPQEDFNVKRVGERVIRWLLERRMQGLPKTIQKLRNAIAGMCNLTVQVDAKLIYIHLLLNDVVRKQGEKVILNEENTRTEMHGFVLSESSGEGVSPEFARCLHKAVHWVRNIARLPPTEWALLRCLEQVCRLKLEVRVDDIVRILEAQEYIAIQPQTWDGAFATEQRVAYNLPPLPCAHVHYCANVRGESAISC